MRNSFNLRAEFSVSREAIRADLARSGEVVRAANGGLE